METEKKQFYKVNEVKKLFSISRSTIYRLLSAGKLQGVKLGSTTLIKASSVAEYFESAPKFVSGK